MGRFIENIWDYIVRVFILLISTFLLNSTLHSEETRYIRDTLYVEIRTGQSLKHRIVHRGLISGTPVTVLEAGEDEKYTRIRTQNGIEGWIQSQYLMTEPAAREQLKEAQTSISALKNQNRYLQKNAVELRSERQEYMTKNQTLTKQRQALQEELERVRSVSAEAIQLDNDVKRLLLDNQALNNKVDVLIADNQRLSDDQSNDAFLNGALAVLIGVIIALLTPRLWPSKSSEWA